MIRRRTVLSALPLLAAAPALAEAPFAAFLADVRAQAVGSGVAPATVDRAFAGLRPNPKVLELDSHPAEKTQSWAQYRAARFTAARVAAGRRAMQANREVLDVIGRRYGVDPAVVVAIWGVETGYGSYTGGFPVIEALATLAADGRRDGYFRQELLNALRILDEGDIALPRMTGSYAGAMGQPQFMPSSYLQYAVSYDGGPRRDIWDNRNDALASIANYLAHYGWRPGVPWGQPVRLPAGPPPAPGPRSLADWSRLGVTRPDGAALARPELTATLLLPDGPGGLAYLAHENFAVIRRYNHSDDYVLSVGELADAIAA